MHLNAELAIGDLATYVGILCYATTRFLRAETCVARSQ